MTDQDKNDLFDLLNFFAEGYGINKVTSVRVQFYYSALSDMSLSQVKKSLNILARTWKAYGRLPAPVEIREANQGDPDQKATEAWIKANNAKDSYKTVIFDDYIIHGVVESIGGWIAFSSGEGFEGADGLKWQRKEFIQSYKSLANSDGNWPMKLIGITEGSNSEKGYLEYIPEPKLIGDISQERLKLIKN